MGKNAPLSAARREGPDSGVGLVGREVKGEKGVEGSLVWEVEVDSDYSGDHQEVFTPGEVLPGVTKSLGDIVSGDDVVDLGLLGERESCLHRRKRDWNLARIPSTFLRL